MRHTARDACEKPERKVAGALKDGLSDRAEEQQETKIREQVIQINVHKNSADDAPPLAGEDRFSLHADCEQHRIEGMLGLGVIRKNLQAVSGDD